MKVFGLDVCDTSLALVLLEKKQGRIRILNQARVELGRDIIENGEVKDKEKFIQAIKKLVKKAKIETSYLVFSIPDSQTFNYVFEFPKELKEKEIEKTLLYEAESVIPLPREDVYWDYRIISQNKTKEVFYVCCLKKIIDDYLEIFEKSKLIPLVCDIEANSLARALIEDIKEEGILICDIGARTTNISIFDLFGIRLCFTYGIAGNRFTEVIAENLKIPFEEAEEKKRKDGLEGLKEILAPLLENIIKEIEKIRNYYQNKTKRRIKKLLLSGGSSKLKGIENFFKEKLDLEVEIGKPWFLKGYTQEKILDEPHFINALGLALRGLDKKSLKLGVNLLPKRTKYDIIKVRKIAKISLIVLSLILVLFLFYSFRDRVVSFVKLLFRPIGIVREKIEVNFTVLLKNFLEEEIEKTKNFESTGIKTVEKQARGEVIIFNQTETERRLLAGARLLTPDNKLFRLTKKTTIPPLGSVVVEAYSQGPGKGGEIEKGVKFTIPAFPPELQKLIYAESKEKFSGGTEEVKIISEEDLKRANENLKEEIKKEAFEILKKRLKENEQLIEESLALEILKEEKPKVGTRVENFSFKMRAKVKIAFFNQEEILKEAKKILEEKKIKNYQLKDLEYRFLEIKENKTKVEFIIKVK